ncbi:dimethylsulfonioproprionate lyase family protein [Tabrizicola sp.]|uniref:dimethylsulfonioproprionate lyase family protein n=1 Tax=Tabrizicola sp. TaxID=2005166 RepID=UPI00273309A0|nr:dimethylsulfonioproprionate lyase family protein [Tabrizicola sp.]MDP3198178.1 dimethylsulfonioproprionate lyase family protein [Tabrizicola sp.]
MILSPLLSALADLTAAEPRPEALTTARLLRAAAETDFPPQPASSLSPGILHAAALPDAHPAARLVGEAHTWLPWQDSPAAALQPTALRAIKSIVTLLGPGAPIPSHTHLFGLFYQAPGSYYPLHAHEAAETYILLAGSAEWQAADRRFPLSAGGSSHHPPNLPHAMRAGPEGFLALWRWSGDIAFDSYRMLPDPQA